jgi:hypothetical protein
MAFMKRCATCALALAFLFIPNHVVIADDHDGHDHSDHGEEMEMCACAALESDHPFTIDCSDSAAVVAAIDAFKSADCGANSEDGMAKCVDMEHYAETCVTYALIVQTHHDYCDYQDAVYEPMAENGEHLLGVEWHAMEEFGCFECAIDRKYIAGNEMCPTVNCENEALLTDTYATLLAAYGASAANEGDAASICPTNHDDWWTFVSYHDCEDHGVYTDDMDSFYHFEDIWEACEDTQCNQVGPDDPDPAVCVPIADEHTEDSGAAATSAFLAAMAVAIAL